MRSLGSGHRAAPLTRSVARHAGEPKGAPSSEAEAAVQAEENPEVHRLTGLPLHILVVDDDPNLRALLRTSFEVADIEVEEADSAESAAAKIAARHPDVMVLDVGMPRMDGITFCRGLKSDPFTREIPIVLLTGDATMESSGRQAGADAFLRKPFSPLALLTIAERLGATPQENAPTATSRRGATTSSCSTRRTSAGSWSSSAVSDNSCRTPTARRSLPSPVRSRRRTRAQGRTPSAFGDTRPS